MTPEQTEATRAALQEGVLSLKGEFMWGSNYTYLVDVEHLHTSLQAVYKPTRGVRPLWDFPPPTLARRETAAWLVSEALGWELVPVTVYRKDGPMGPGSLQFYIDHDPEYHYFNYTEEDRQRLRPAALFDLLLNNADRKGSHILIDPGQHMWLIDHGLCFHTEEKLRTVIWDFAGEAIPENLNHGLRKLLHQLKPPDPSEPDQPASEFLSSLHRYIHHAEIAALARRTERLLASGCFSNPDPNRRQYPWPPV
jgi:hypothetical protein